MLEEIKVFVQVVQSGSFTAAADRLGLSRSLVSKKISQLEAELGVRLLNRTTRRLSRTEAGELFFQSSRSGLASIEGAIDEIRSMNREPRGRLFVNLPMSFGLLHVAPWVGEFMERYPGIHIDLDFEDRKVEVIEPGFDLTIRVSDLEPSSLFARRLATCHHVVVAAPSYIARRGRPSVPQDLTAGHTIASFRYQDSAIEWIFEGEDVQRVRLEAAMESNNSLALKEVVLSGAAMARMPTFLVGPDIAAGRLERLCSAYRCPSKVIFALFPVRQYLPNKTRLFLDYLATKISDPPVWDEVVFDSGIRG